MVVRNEAEILAGLRHRHIGHAPVETGLTAEVRSPHQMLGLLRPVGVLTHRQLAGFGRAHMEVRHAGDDDVVIRHDADRCIACETVGMELYEEIAVRESLLEHPRQRVGEAHIAVGLRDAFVFHAARQSPIQPSLRRDDPTRGSWHRRSGRLCSRRSARR